MADPLEQPRKKRRKRRRSQLPPYWPTNRYPWEELVKFYARERHRVAEGELTHQRWLMLSSRKQGKIESPERRYWRRRMDNEKRAASRRVHRYRRQLEISKSSERSAARFYREIRGMALVQCAYCPRELPGKQMHIDHVVPLIRGGKHTRANLVAACPRCNWRKNALTGDEFRAKIVAGKTAEKVHGKYTDQPSQNLELQRAS